MDLGAANRKVAKTTRVGFDARGSVIITQDIALAIGLYLIEMV